MLTRAKQTAKKLLRMRRHSEDRLIKDAQKYWNNSSDDNLATNSHWRGNGPFQDDGLWLGLGRQHRELIDKALSWVGQSLREQTAIEWGCGGGMNAFALAPEVQHYYGVDISPESLQECRRQIDSAGLKNLSEVLVEAAEPESVRGKITEPCSVFLCTYVFELLPTPEYGLRILALANELLTRGGIALIQIRYHNGIAEQQSRRHNYQENSAQMTTYRIDEFWLACSAAGFEPLFVTLVPELPELREHRYAYFALQKT